MIIIRFYNIGKTKSIIQASFLHTAKTLLIFLLSCIAFESYSSHIAGGSLSYKYNGGSSYTITFRIYRDCDGISAPGSVTVNVRGLNGATFSPDKNFTMSQDTFFPISLELDTCADPPDPEPCLEEYIYSETVNNLPSSTDGYHLYTSSLCCRNAAITNVSSSDAGFYTYIPGIPDHNNDSPVFGEFPPLYLCAGGGFSIDHSATDGDGDSLVYSVYDPFRLYQPSSYSGNIAVFDPVVWVTGYSASNPLGGGDFSIDSETGLLTGTAPLVGKFVVGIKVDEYRNGVKLNSTLRDFQFNVVECGTPDAELPDTIFNCDNDATNFYNLAGTASDNWWNFGDPDTQGDTSLLAEPDYTYALPGIYDMILIINKDDPLCENSDTGKVVISSVDANFNVQNTCDQKEVFFTDLSASSDNASITAWEWYFGDGNTSAQQNPIHTYAPTDTSFEATLIVHSDLGCTDTFTQSITTPLTSPDYTVTNYCVGDTIYFEGTYPLEGVITKWEWYFGNLDTLNAQDTGFVFPQPGIYPVTLKVYNSEGCSDSIIKPIKIFDRPSPAFIATEACLGTATEFTDLSDSTSNAPILSWFWDFGDGYTSTSQNVTHIYGSDGTYEVQLTVCDSVCCTTIQKDVIVRPLPNSGFSYLPQTCARRTISFIDQSVNNPVAWQWDFGDGNNSSLQDPEHVYDNPGQYSVTLIVFNGFCYDTVTNNVYIQETPVASFSSTSPVCFNDSMQFTDNSVYDTKPITQWEWHFGDGNISTVQNPVHGYANSGEYDVMVIISNEFNCKDTAINSVTVYPELLADFTTDLAADTGCNNKEVVFNSGLSTGNIISWKWDFDYPNNVISTDSITAHAYNAPGDYNIRLIISDSLCSDTIFKTLTVLPEITADFNFETSCTDDSVRFTDNSLNSPEQWLWNFGDAGNNTSTLQHPINEYNLPGSYVVTLIATNTGCSDTVSRNISIMPDLKAGFESDPNLTSGCITLNTNVTFSDTSNGAVTYWNWDFGDGNTSGDQNPIHTYIDSGSYNIQLIVRDSLCSDTINQAIEILPLLEVDFSVNEPCANVKTFFFDETEGSPVSWFWSFGDGNTDTVQNPVYTYANPGVYNVKLVVQTENCSMDSLEKLVYIGLQPVADFSFETACINDETSFFDQSVSLENEMISWQWDFDDGQFGDIQNPVNIYSSPGKYDVMLIAWDSLCRDTAVKTINILPRPSATFNWDKQSCAGSTICFYDSSSYDVNKWSWDFGDGNYDTLQKPCHMYEPGGPTKYAVSLKVSNGVCDSTITANNVIIKPAPVADISHNAPVCQGNPVTFSNSSYVGSSDPQIDSLSWYIDNTLFKNRDTVTYFLNDTGTYIVTLEVMNTVNCSDTITDTISVLPELVADFTFAPEVLCDNNLINFKDISVGYPELWEWDLGNGKKSAEKAPLAFYEDSGLYEISLTVSNQVCGSDDTTKMLNVLPSPEVSLGGDTTVCPDYFLPMKAYIDTDVDAYLWSTGDITPETSVNMPPSEEPITDTIWITVEHNGCFASDTLLITNKCNPDIWIPNAFAPAQRNSDVHIFYVKGNDIDIINNMKIFTRWGELVFETSNIQPNNPEFGWDGTYKGELLHTQVFIYYVEFTLQTGKVTTEKGNVTLIR